MRNNQPITRNERTFPAATKLISVTDTHGTILECNDAFVEVSGFNKAELIGKPHNIVRHPEMPAAAFEIMWNHLKAGKPWMGLVKNRCKNGDFYWVDAYVTPITEHGKVVGYESVRSCPKRDDVSRAEALYASINKGQAQQKNSTFSAMNILVFVLSALWFGLFFAGFEWVAFVCSLITLQAFVFYQTRMRRAEFRALRKLMTSSFSHELAALTYTGTASDYGLLKTAIISQRAHLNTVLTRIDSSATNVMKSSEQGQQLTQQTFKQIEQQQSETFQVATAMNEMTTTIAEVSKHVSDTASHAENANKLAIEGSSLAEVTKLSIKHLRDTVSDISVSVAEVSDQTSHISSAAQMIEQIADQTNLLALNAAIEAARAGEQGRGFAVVADEVRNLAKRTQQSTKDIYEIVRQLTQKADSAVRTANLGTSAADEGLQKVVDSAEMLKGISESVGQIAHMAIQMAAAVEQQAHVADDINRQVVNISELASSTSDSARETSSSVSELKNTADQLHELVTRFKQ